MRKITDMLVLYVLCAVLESACGITNHVVVSLLLLFIEVCAVIYLQSMAGRTFAVTGYLLSFLVIKETSYGFPVVLYAVWEQVLEAWEKKEIKRTAVAGITVFLWVFFGVAASRYILSGTDRIQWQILWIVFDMLAVYLRQMTWQDRELQKEFIRIQDADRVKLLLREHPAFYQILIQDNGKCVHPGGRYGNRDYQYAPAGGNVWRNDRYPHRKRIPHFYPHSKSRYSCRKMRNCPGFFHCRFAAKLPGK